LADQDGHEPEEPDVKPEPDAESSPPPPESSTEAGPALAQEAAPDSAPPPEPLPQPEPTPERQVEAPLLQGDVAPSVARQKRRAPFLRRLVTAVLSLVVFGPPAVVLVYRFLPPPITELMVQRMVQGYGFDYQWRPLSQISPALPQAAVASEDARFCSHHGFDFQAMQKAMAHNERRPNRIKGGSTISQQTAKNVFLWPGRSYVRKGIEAWYTVLIETLWGKRRIMEVYLNVVEFGQGVYGAQAAAQHFFHEDASQLSPEQAAHLIAVLPRPLKWRATAPGAYVARRSNRIDGAIGTVRDDGLAGCVGR